MADLKTSYMGIALENPIIAGASELTGHMDSIKKIEDSGAGALIIKSLFEEQIQLERARFEEEQGQYSGFNAEMSSLYPEMEHSGPDTHLMWVRKAREAVSIPVFASLNAVNKDTWTEWAVKLQETGVDGLELNFFANPEQQADNSASIEQEQLEVVQAVLKSVKIPVAIKMSLFYTTPITVARKFSDAGAQGLVLFNKFFQPDIDVEKETNTLPLNLSTSTANRLPLRYAGLLYGNVNACICASSGIMDGLDVAKMLLAGADVVQVVSTLYKNRITQLGRLVSDLSNWMDAKGYENINAFKGKMSRQKSDDPWVYKRAQYAKLLMKPNPMGIIR